MMLKIIIFTLIFGFVIPAGTYFAIKYPKVRLVAFILMLAFTCNMQMIHLYPLPDWRGSARGFAFSMVDINASIVFLSIWFDSRCSKRFFPPGYWTYLIYYLFIVISGINALYLQPWGFEVLKMFWMYIFFVASFNFLMNYKNLWTIIYTICGIVFYMFLVGFYQKYISGGYYQIPSTMPHQNSLTLYVEIFGSIILGVMLNEKTKHWQSIVLIVGFFSCLLLSIFTYSRGGLFCFMLATSMVGMGSIALNGITSQKVSFIAMGVVGGIILLAIAMPRIIQRFETAPEASKNTRIFLAKAAVRMAHDYRVGVGANNFSAHSGATGIYAAEMYENKKITEDTSPFGGIVETIYLLVAAECGWVALGALLLWFAYYFILAVRCVWSLRYHSCFGISLGVFSGLLANFSQSTIEWSLKQYGNFYQLMFVFALISAIWTCRKSLRKR